ncbi:ESX-1 secretion-associated protein EspB [Mycobacterium marinum]|nr:ESX-1 secretion-associated protein EspB [Mycobacterium marinum]
MLAACALDPAVAGAMQLALSAESMRAYLQSGAQARQRLAQFMRDAAKAYEQIDEGAATALGTNGHGIGAPPVPAGTDLPLPALADTPTAPAAPPSPYTGVKLAAINLNKPDQGVSLKKFAHDWNAYNLTIQQSLGRFRDFENWEGEAATAVQAAFDQHRDWLRLMARLSTTMAKQASGLEQAHHWAIGQHPTLADITTLEEVLRDPRVPDKKPFMKVYAQCQKKSEEVLTGYATRTITEPVQPPRPPAAPTHNDPKPPPPLPPLPPSGDPTLPFTGTPPMPTMPFTPPPAATPDTTEAARAAATLATGPTVKPAALGGGAGAAIPLTAPLGAGPTPPGAPGALGPGTTPTGRPLGAGPMAGMPLGANSPAHTTKTKRTHQDDRALYTEQRPWTEALIGPARPHLTTTTTTEHKP